MVGKKRNPRSTYPQPQRKTLKRLKESKKHRSNHTMERNAGKTISRQRKALNKVEGTLHFYIS